MACRQEAGKQQLVRFVRSPQGIVELDPGGRAPGRGAYLHASLDCVELARKRRSLDRALVARVDEHVWDELVVRPSDGPDEPASSPPKSTDRPDDP